MGEEMKKIHYIMPMAGSGSRFYKKGFCQPKPLIPIYGKPFFYWAVQSIRKFVEITSLDFVVLYEHVDKFGIDKEILKYVDVLIDGQYDCELNDPTLQWRGSSNQRIIDVQNSLKNNKIIEIQ